MSNEIRKWYNISIDWQIIMGNHPPKLSDEDKKKLEKGEPVMMGSGIKITKNPKTGKL